MNTQTIWKLQNYSHSIFLLPFLFFIPLYNEFRNCSATEGADSHPASGGGTPTGDEGQIGQGKGDEVKSTCHTLIGNQITRDNFKHIVLNVESMSTRIANSKRLR